MSLSWIPSMDNTNLWWVAIDFVKPWALTKPCLVQPSGFVLDPSRDQHKILGTFGLQKGDNEYQQKPKNGRNRSWGFEFARTRCEHKVLACRLLGVCVDLLLHKNTVWFELCTKRAVHESRRKAPNISNDEVICQWTVQRKRNWLSESDDHARWHILASSP